MFTLAGRWIWWRATVLMLAGVVALLPSGTASAVPSACFADLHRAGLTAARTAEAGTGVGRRIVETSTVVVRAPWGGEFSSNDGGYTWVPVPFSKSGPCSYLHLPYEWEDTVHTPRGIYSIEDTGIVLTSGSFREVVYSTKFLQEAVNKRQQSFATRRFEFRTLTSEPKGITYDEASGNVVVTMGFLGVLVGDPTGNWHRVSVGPYYAMDFSMVGKARLVFREPGLWLSALALAVAIAVSVMILSRVLTYRRWVSGILLAAVVIPPSALTIDLGISAPDLYLRVWSISAPTLSGFFLVVMLALPRVNTTMGWLGVILLAIVVGLASGFLAMCLIIFVFGNELVGNQLSHIQIGLAAFGIMLAGLIMAPCVRRMSQDWHLPFTVATLGVTVLIVALTFVIAMSYFYLGHVMVYLIVLLGLTALSLMADSRHLRASLGVLRGDGYHSRRA